MMVFERGNVGMAVRASSSVPGVFQPVAINGREYVDGGLVSPVPIGVARRLGADVVIAVDISTRPAGQDTTGAVDILLQTFNIMGQVIARMEFAGADVVLRPAVDRVGSTDFTSRVDAIRLGEEAATAQFAAIDEALLRARLALGPATAPPGPSEPAQFGAPSAVICRNGGSDAARTGANEDPTHHGC
jgi:NTE family protein